MPETAQIRMGQRGVVTLPKEMRESCHLETGTELTVLNLDGVIVISPRRSEIDYVADQIEARLGKRGETLETMLKAVREERERYGR